MSLTKTAIITMAITLCGGPAFAQAQQTCTQQDIKLKYTEIGQLITAEMGGDLAGASHSGDEVSQ
jgi:hypothetical protein